MLNSDLRSALADPSLLLFNDLSILELREMFTDADAERFAAQAGLKARTVSELAYEVSSYRRLRGWSGRLPDS